MADRYDIVAHDSVLASVTAALALAPTLYEWASVAPQARTLSGRAPVYVATLPTSDITVAVRHAWHGGVFAPLTRDRFLAPTRAPSELQHALTLARLGIPTTEVLAYVRYSAGPGMQRVDVATRFLEGTADFGAVLRRGGDTATSIRSVGALLQQLALHRVYHPDLNVKNILIDVTTPAMKARVIDIDVLKLQPARSTRDLMQNNLVRLVRSMRKSARLHNIAGVDDAIAALTGACELVEATP